MNFVAMIEFQTLCVDDLLRLDDMWRTVTDGLGAECAMRVAKDLDRHDRYVWIVEFASHDEALRTGALDRLQRLADESALRADGPAVFHHLDVLQQPVP